MAKNSLAVIGSREIALAFKAIGAVGFTPQNDFEAQSTIKNLVEQGYPVILITEELAERISGFIEKYKMSLTAIIPIPDGKTSTGYGMKGIDLDTEKAIGTTLNWD